MSSTDDQSLQNDVESVDEDFFNVSLYRKAQDPIDTADSEKDSSSRKDVTKSQRHLEFQETFDIDMQVPQSMKDHLGKRLSAAISSQVEFVEPMGEGTGQSTKRKSLKNRVKLFNDCDVPIKNFDPWETYKGPGKKPEIKRRIIEPENLNEYEKVKASVLDACDLKSGKEVNLWATRRERKDKIFRYKRSKTGDTLHFLEPENEFTKLRKKNCWSEKNIAKLKIGGMGINITSTS